MSAEPPFTHKGLLRGARRTLPLAVSVVVYGTVFGALARQAGMSSLESILMSSLVFAGSAQFIALELWRTPLPVAALALTTLVVNLRHLLMGATLAGWIRGLPRRRLAASAAVLSDESWALTTHAKDSGEHDRAFMIGSGLILLASWVGGTTIGALAGSLVNDPAAIGLDFTFAAVFLTLLVSFWRGQGNLAPWACSAGIALAVESTVSGPWFILAGGLTGSFIGAVRDGRRA